MPQLRHGFCSLHLIGYNRDLDATCPQCIIARILPPKQYAYDVALQSAVDAAGKPVAREAILTA